MAKSIMDLVREKKAAIKAATGRSERAFKVQPGKNRYRILPTWRADSDDVTFFHDFSQHWIKKNGKVLAVMVCEDKTYGRPCSVCNAIMEGVTGASDDTVIGELEEAVSRGQVLVNALWLDAPEKSEKVTPKIMALSPTTFEKICELMEDYGDITDPQTGTDINITRTGTGKNTEYTVMPAPKSVKVPASVLAKLNDIDAYVASEAAGGDVKALAAVSSVSGLLPSASASAGKKSTDVHDDEIDDDPFEGELDDADLEDDEADDEPPAKAVETEELSDDAMDDLLAGLDEDLDLTD